MSNELATYQFGENLISDEVVGVDMQIAGLTDMTDDKVLSAVRKVFPDCDLPEPMAFKTAEDVVNYMVEVSRDCGAMYTSTVSSNSSVHGAMYFRRWGMSRVLAQAAQTMGDSVKKCVQERFKLSDVDYYAMRDMAGKITAVQAYVLGSHLCANTTLQSLLSIPDKDTRDKLIDKFCEDTSNLSDYKARVNASRKIIQVAKVALLPVAGSSTLEDKGEGDAIEAVEADIVPKEYFEAERMLKKAASVASTLSEGFANNLSAKLGAISSLLGAARDDERAFIFLDGMLGDAEVIITDLGEAAENLQTIKQAIEEFQGLTSVLHGDVQDVPAELVEEGK